MKVILQAIKALFRKIEASRTHWEEVEEVEIITETTVTISEDNSYAELPKTTQLTVGQTYFVILDGVPYECVAWYSDDEDAVIIGNGAIFGGEGGNGEPFSCDSYSSGNICLNTEKAGTYTISISTKENIIHKLDKKYLPDEVIESIDIANNAQTTVNSKMNANNPVGTGSFSMGRNANSVVGINSHAEGYNTTASGSYSHAEGYYSTASGNNSHAECYNTTASGSNSHAEGYLTTASGSYSHAEGFHTTASGINSHAEGSYTTASSYGSHTEGLNTTASGYGSHAEGEYCIARGKNQHVQGKYNIGSGTPTSIVDSDYAHIVGNGKNGTNRSNAYTLTWSGIPWYQGRPQFGGTAMDNGSQTVMANGDKEIILASSTAGSTKKFKITVDDSGTLSATEVS